MLTRSQYLDLSEEIPRIGLVWRIVRRQVTPALWKVLVVTGLADDFRQEALLIAMEGRNLPERDFLRHASKGVYRFLRKYGFRRSGPGFYRDKTLVA